MKTVVESVDCCLGENYDVSQKGQVGVPSITCPRHHEHFLVMTTEKDMEQHILH